jgi:hypothetical protein
VAVKQQPIKIQVPAKPDTAVPSTKLDMDSPSNKNPVLRIRDVYPESRIPLLTHPGSRIPDPKIATKERGEKKFVVIPFFGATYFT